jgi:hypothetical protein
VESGPFVSAEDSLGSLLDLLGNARDFMVTDPRDRIFSLLGISNEGLEPVLAVQTPDMTQTRTSKLLFHAFNSVRNYTNSHFPDFDVIPSEFVLNYEKEMWRFVEIL